MGSRFLWQVRISILPCPLPSVTLILLWQRGLSRPLIFCGIFWGFCTPSIDPFARTRGLGLLMFFFPLPVGSGGLGSAEVISKWESRYFVHIKHRLRALPGVGVSSFPEYPLSCPLFLTGETEYAKTPFPVCLSPLTCCLSSEFLVWVRVGAPSDVGQGFHCASYWSRKGPR